MLINATADESITGPVECFGMGFFNVMTDEMKTNLKARFESLNGFLDTFYVV
jgi:hypothetical protein